MKICDMPKIERDEKGRFMRGVSQCPEFYKKAIQTRKNTILKRGYYFSEETKVGSGVSECYQKGGIHYYCASEDEMCSGCTAPVKIDKRRCLI
jgi:hypothetical protein